MNNLILESLIGKMKKIKKQTLETKTGCGIKECDSCALGKKALIKECYHDNSKRRTLFDLELESIKSRILIYLQKGKRF